MSVEPVTLSPVGLGAGAGSTVGGVDVAVGVCVGVGVGVCVGVAVGVCVGVAVGVCVGVGVGVRDRTLMLMPDSLKPSLFACRLNVAVPPGSQPLKANLNGTLIAMEAPSSSEAALGHELFDVRGPLTCIYISMLDGTTLNTHTSVVSPTSMVVLVAPMVPERAGLGVGVSVGVGVGVFVAVGGTGVFVAVGGTGVGVFVG